MRKISLLTILSLLILSLFFNPLKINAMSENELNEKGEETLDDNYTRSIPGGENNYGEEWYYLSITEPTLNDYINYSPMNELLKYLKPGDIIYETNGSPIGDMTKHIAIVPFGENEDEDILFFKDDEEETE